MTSNTEKNDIYFMQRAIELAKKAAEIGEVPIGAVIVRNGEIISEAYNLRETQKLATAHAELYAIEAACKKLGGWRLPGCEMYVTLEPCPMCAGAILNSRIEHIYFGAPDEKSGCCGTKLNLMDMNLCNFKVPVTGGVLEKECKEIIKEFFRDLRKK